LAALRRSPDVRGCGNITEQSFHRDGKGELLLVRSFVVPKHLRVANNPL